MVNALLATSAAFAVLVASASAAPANYNSDYDSGYKAPSYDSGYNKNYDSGYKKNYDSGYKGKDSYAVCKDKNQKQTWYDDNGKQYGWDNSKNVACLIDWDTSSYGNYNKDKSYDSGYKSYDSGYKSPSYDSGYKKNYGDDKKSYGDYKSPSYDSGYKKNYGDDHKSYDSGYKAPSYDSGYKAPSYDSGYKAPSYDSGYKSKPSYFAANYDSGYKAPSYDSGYKAPSYDDKKSYGDDKKNYDSGYKAPSYDDKKSYDSGYKAPSYDSGYKAPSYDSGYKSPEKSYDSGYKSSGDYKPSYGGDCESAKSHFYSTGSATLKQCVAIACAPGQSDSYISRALYQCAALETAARGNNNGEIPQGW